MILAKKPNISQLSNSLRSTGQHCHIKEESCKDAIMDNHSGVVFDNLGYDTYEDGLLYFACVSNHFLHSVKTRSKDSSISHHAITFQVKVDSGASYHMFLLLVALLFWEMDKTPLIGRVKFKIGLHTVILKNVE
jgi:hypothetical protein